MLKDKLKEQIRTREILTGNGAVDTIDNIDKFEVLEYILENKIDLVEADCSQDWLMKHFNLNCIMCASLIEYGIINRLDTIKYATPDFDKHQLSQINDGLRLGLDVSIYAKSCFSGDQMYEIKLGIQGKLDTLTYANPAITAPDMRKSRKELEDTRSLKTNIMGLKDIKEAIEMIHAEFAMSGECNAKVMREIEKMVVMGRHYGDRVNQQDAFLIFQICNKKEAILSINPSNAKNGLTEIIDEVCPLSRKIRDPNKLLPLSKEAGISEKILSMALDNLLSTKNYIFTEVDMFHIKLLGELAEPMANFLPTIKSLKSSQVLGALTAFYLIHKDCSIGMANKLYRFSISSSSFIKKIQKSINKVFEESCVNIPDRFDNRFRSKNPLYKALMVEFHRQSILEPEEYALIKDEFVAYCVWKYPEMKNFFLKEDLNSMNGRSAMAGIAIFGDTGDRWRGLMQTLSKEDSFDFRYGSGYESFWVPLGALKLIKVAIKKPEIYMWNHEDLDKWIRDPYNILHYY